MNPVVEAILARRSWRIYLDAPLPADTLAALRRAAELAPSVRGGAATRVELLDEPTAVHGLTRAITGNLVGKTNLWLRSAPPSAYAALVGDAERGRRHGDRFLYNVDVALTGELLALVAAAQGAGSCWMSAIDQTGVGRHLGLASHERVPSVLALGLPGRKRKSALFAAGWDRITRLVVSGRRKALADLHAVERFGDARRLPAADLDTLPDDARPLLEILAALTPSAGFGGVAPAPADLARLLEAMRLAPSADNAQTWRFVVTTDRARVAELLDAAGSLAAAAAAPGALVVLAAAPFLLKKINSEQPFALIDHPIALTHALLVAETLGLHWNASIMFDHGAVRRAAGFPEDHPVTALLWLDREGERSTAPHPEHVHLFRR